MKNQPLIYLVIALLLALGTSCSQESGADRGVDVGGETVTTDADPFPCYEVAPNFVGMKGIGDPSVKDIMALGQLGGTLCPTLPPKTQERSLKQPLSDAEILEQNKVFGHAMDLWNEHSYKEASKELKDYLEKYPEGLWAGEAELHLGCEARFNGRYNEANAFFSNIIVKYGQGDSSGHRKIVDKAKSRLAVQRVLENNPEAATGYFAQLAKGSDDWRLRTYAQTWISRIARMKQGGSFLADCGYRALEAYLRSQGKDVQIDKIPKERQGQSLLELKKLSAQHGASLEALHIPIAQLKDVPLPAIVQVDRNETNGAGHYWVLEKNVDGVLTLYDAQAGRRFEQTELQFAGEWSGYLLAFNPQESLHKYLLSDEEAEKIFGGCCGIQRPESNLGNPDDTDDPADEDPCENGGCPRWKVNMANINLYVYDIPLWYDTPYGPDVKIKLSYNSQSALQHYEIFGNKWTFNYATYVLEDPGKTATVFMADGDRLIFTANQSGGFERAYASAARLERNKKAKGYKFYAPNGEVYHYDLIRNYSITVQSGSGTITQPSALTSAEEITTANTQALTVTTVAQGNGQPTQQAFLTRIDAPDGKSVSIRYNEQFQPVSIVDAQGRTTSLTYNDNGTVVAVEDPFGRQAHFEYDGSKLVAITDVNGYRSSLTYDDNLYITSITKPQGTWTFYTEPADGIRNGSDHYPAPGKTMWEDYRLTITDPNDGKSEYHFDGYSNVSWYVSPKNYIPYVDRSNNNYAKALKERYKYSNKKGTSRLVSKTFTDGVQQYYRYDYSGQLTQFDSEGFSVGSSYDTNRRASRQWQGGRFVDYEYMNGFPIKMTTLGANDDKLVIKYVYDNALKLPLSMTLSTEDESEQRTWRYSYNEYGQVVKVDGPREDVEDITTFTYHDCSNKSDCGNLASSTDAEGNVTYFDQYVNGEHIGRVRQPNGLTTLYTYDALGRVLSVTQQDGRRDLGTIRYEYAAPQQGPIKAILADGTSLTIRYDAEGRKTEVVDSLGNRLEYTRDKDGNVTSQTLYDTSGELAKRIEYEYDVRNRVKQLLDSSGVSKNQFEYDRRGNLIAKIDALGNKTSNNYNYQTNELSNQTDAGGGRSSFSYTISGKIKSLTDAEDRTTEYTYNVFGDLIKVNSPDAGVTTYQYDHAGLRLSKTDARGITTNYQYDVLGRITRLTFPDATENVEMTYYPPRERRVEMRDEDGSSLYTLDAYNRIVSHERKQNNETFTTEYTYNISGKVTHVKYPSGHQVRYNYNAHGQIESIDLKAGRLLYRTIIKDITYRADGSIESLTYSNGRTQKRVFDTDGRLTEIVYPGKTERYTYTLNDNISQIEHGTEAETFSYDVLNRLTSALGIYGSLTYTYDRIGNRLQEERDSNVARQFMYDSNLKLTEVTQTGVSSKPSSTEPIRDIDWRTSFFDKRNQVGKGELVRCPANGKLRTAWGTGIYTDRSSICTAAVHAGLIDVANGGVIRVIAEKPQSRYIGSEQNGVSTRSYYAYWFGSFRVAPVNNSISVHAETNFELEYDAVGNTIRKGDLSLTYNNRNRLATIEGPLVSAAYKYNAQGLRSSKVVDNIRTDYVYFQGQRVLAWREGHIWNENIYLGGEIVAVLQDGNLYFSENDYMGKPLRLIDERENVVWNASWKPYRESDVTHNGVNYLQRFPGQLLDEETGFYYNMFREYDPQTGRYLQSDPIGLRGGWNTYAYVGGNPVMGVDPMGLVSCWYRVKETTLTCMSITTGDIVTLGPDYVFSGPEPFGNNPTFDWIPYMGAIPQGMYDIVQKYDKLGKKIEHFYRLLPEGKSLDESRENCSAFRLKRCGFQIHPGNLSAGCITIDRKMFDLGGNKDFPDYGRSFEELMRYVAAYNVRRNYLKLEEMIAEDLSNGYPNQLYAK